MHTFFSVLRVVAVLILLGALPQFAMAQGYGAASGQNEINEFYRGQINRLQNRIDELEMEQGSNTRYLQRQLSDAYDQLERSRQALELQLQQERQHREQVELLNLFQQQQQQQQQRLPTTGERMQSFQPHRQPATRGPRGPLPSSLRQAQQTQRGRL